MRLFLILWVMLLPISGWAELRVKLSERTIALNGTLVLELELDRASSATPNLTELSERFSVLDLERILLSSVNRDQTEYRTRWTLTLRPREAGTVEIPTLVVDGTQSRPVSVQVREPLNRPQIEARVVRSEPPYYPKAPILIDLLITHAQPLPEGVKVELEATGSSSVYALTTLSRSADSENQSQQRFAVFPSEPGSLRLPALKLQNAQGTIITSLPGELITVTLPAYQADRSVWFPANQVRVTDSWSELRRIPGVEELTRTLQVEAVGTLAIDIPALPTPAGFERIEARLEQESDPFGVISRRTEVWAVNVASSPTVSFEASELLWWDLDAAQTRSLVIPARSLVVETAPTEDIPPAEGTDETQESSDLLLALIALAGLGSTGFVYWRSSRDRQRFASERERLYSELAAAQIQLDEHRTYIALEQACFRGQADRAARLLIDWCQFVWPNSDATSLDSLCLNSDDPQFNLLVFQLNDYLIDAEQDRWDGDALGEKVRSVRRQHLMLMGAEEKMDD